MKSVKSDLAKFKKTKKLILKWIAIALICIVVAIAAYFGWSWHRTNVLTAGANALEARTTSLTTVLEGIRTQHAPPAPVPAPAAATAAAATSAHVAGGYASRGWNRG